MCCSILDLDDDRRLLHSVVRTPNKSKNYTGKQQEKIRLGLNFENQGKGNLHAPLFFFHKIYAQTKIKIKHDKKQFKKMTKK